MLRLLSRFFNAQKGSVLIIDEKIINKFVSDSEFPYLVSFPRTGSHWLRMLMELYFERPSLTRAFYYHHSRDFTCYHHHDEDLKLYRTNVIYLFRDPVATIFSQMNYYNEDVNNRDRVIYWADLYGRHLEKWLVKDSFTTKKTVLRYENLKKDLKSEFRKLSLHLSQEFNSSKLESISGLVSKQALKKKTSHDMQVVNLESNYDLKRVEFYRNESMIADRILNIDSRLEDYIK